MLQLHFISFSFVIFFAFSAAVDLGFTGLQSSLEITSVDQNSSNGLVVKWLNDNLTLSCSYIRDYEQVAVDNMKLTWSLPRKDYNSWVGGGSLWLNIPYLTAGDAGQYMCVDLDNTVRPAYIYVAVRSQASYPYCSSTTMFPCEPGNLSSLEPPSGPKCVPYTFLCDGRADCPNGRDESADTCRTADPCHDKLPCDDGRCIPKEWCCNVKKGHLCLPHSCCSEHVTVVERTGGGLRRRPGVPLLQTTLYTISACLLIFLIAVTLLISAICKARLKRATFNGSIQGSEQPAECGTTPQSLTNQWGYTLVPNNDTTSPPYNQRSLESQRIMCPGYSESNPRANRDASLPSYFEVQSEITQNNPQVRRPTDFGMSTLANAIFNARYRPVPQEVTSFCEVSDSDSSCRSPGSHTFNIYTSPSRRSITRIDSPLNRFGETPEAYLARRSAEQRRLRRANALDRILDRFGLNAPYAVERETNAQNSTSPNDNFPMSPSGESANASVNGRRQFVSSILGRLRNSFSRSGRTPDASLPPQDGLNNNNNICLPLEYRRPDTPNILELSLDEMDLCRTGSADTYTLNGRTIHLLGASFEERPDLYSLGLQGLYIVDGIVENLNRFVSRPVLPPPYSEVADAAPSKVLGPPPPYMSRENLLIGPAESSLPGDMEAGPSCSNNTPAGDSNYQNCNSFDETVDSNAPSSSNSVLQGNNDSCNVVVGSSCQNTLINSNSEEDPNSNCDAAMDFVSCSHDSTPSIDVDAEVSMLIDILNGNREIVESPVENAVPSCFNNENMSNFYRNVDPSQSNYLDLISRDKSGDFSNNQLINDVSNNNADSDSCSLDARLTDQNENPSSISDPSVRYSDSVTDTPGPTIKRSIFPPISLEFIDSDCVTD